MKPDIAMDKQNIEFQCRFVIKDLITRGYDYLEESRFTDELLNALSGEKFEPIEQSRLQKLAKNLYSGLLFNGFISEQSNITHLANQSLMKYIDYLVMCYFSKKGLQVDQEACRQDIFVIIQKSISNLREPGYFLAWVKTITVNHCTKIYKEEVELGQAIDVDIGDVKILPQKEDQAFHVAETQQSIQCVLLAISRLPNSQWRNVLLLTGYLSDLSDLIGNSEIEKNKILERDEYIAKVLEISKENVQPMRSRARKYIFKDPEFRKCMGLPKRD